MKRSKVKNKANKPENPSDIKNDKKQRNYVLQCKPYFSNKHTNILKHRSTDNFLLLILLSNSLMVYFENLILHQKEK